MLMIEMLAVDWNDRERPNVLQRIPAAPLGVAHMVAKSLLDQATYGGPNAYRIVDEAGSVVTRSWGRPI